MDYCSSCQRHLNGALVCPGCGAYAPDIAPTVPTPLTAAPPAPPVPVRPTEATELAEQTEPPGAIGATPVAPPLSHGRAARRRQLARLKKSQRRAVLATAVALVGGGLTLSTMDRGGSADSAQAATAPETTADMGGVDEPVTEPGTPAVPPSGGTSAPPRTTDPAQPTSPGTPAQRTAVPAAEQPDGLRPQTQEAAPPPAVVPPQPQTTPPSDAVPDPTSRTPPASTPPAAPAAPAPAPSQPPATTDPSDDPSLCLLVICLGG
ncbi:hypothetical protein ACFXAZ_11620 [Streptomyces sp. NPDC059477]|uniref:SCO2400 family protein n=1 Tax=Streptomyces sp. NPDC059477 TaxID=3346847 RepID=UPI0036D17FDF